MKRNITTLIIILQLITSLHLSLMAQLDALATSQEIFNASKNVSPTILGKVSFVNPTPSVATLSKSRLRPANHLPNYLANKPNFVYDTAIVGVTMANDGKGLFGISLSTSSTPNEFGAG
ncbi:MAG: hypothetical protein HKN76_17480, partial [Saprospiraceae bacterium]|nr:hypothetical protein [Saprospiraceae bacterium]